MFKPSVTIELDKSLSEKERGNVIKKIRAVKGTVSIQESFNNATQSPLVIVTYKPPASKEKYSKIKGVSRYYSKGV